MAKKKKSTPKPLTQKELKAMLAQQESNLSAAKERLAQTEETYTSLTTPSAAAEIPADLVRSRVTGLSATQQEAKDVLKEVAREQGGGYLLTSKSAGQVVPKPTTELPEGTEWRWFPTTGGGGSWKAIKLFDPSGGDNKGSGTIFRTINGILYANGSPFTGYYLGKRYESGKEVEEPGGQKTYTAPDGRIFTDLDSYNAYIAKIKADEKTAAGQSAYNLLFEEFSRYDLSALIEPLKDLITEGLSRDEFTLRLRDTDAYKKRFAANAARVQKGLRALNEATYIGLEDQYQEIMRQYGLPESYYSRGDLGRQEGFEKFIANDVAPTELEDRIITAQNRVLNAAPQVAASLRQFYPEITGGDILAYALDPDKAISEIKRKVGAAEIGAGAAMAGLATGLSRAEELQRYGITGEQARQGFQTIADVLPTASKLGDIYAKQGLGAYNQATAEQEVFGIPGAVDAAQKRRKLTQLETAQFSGTSGTSGGALGRERAGQF